VKKNKQDLSVLGEMALSSFPPVKVVKILQNALFIPEEAIYLKSCHVHDFVGHSWQGVDGRMKECLCDGGTSYLKRMMSEGVYYEDFSLYEDDTIDVISSKFLWKTFGKDGKQSGTWVLLKDCETEHLEAILKTQSHIRGGIVEKVIKYLLTKRKKKGKVVK
jgi:hypothetical protein